MARFAANSGGFFGEGRVHQGALQADSFLEQGLEEGGIFFGSRRLQVTLNGVEAAAEVNAFQGADGSLDAIAAASLPSSWKTPRN